MSNQKFGVREITDVVFRAKSPMQIGSQKFERNEPVIYFDSATTSTLEGSSTAVWAQGGRGNARLLSWEGDKQVTFTFEEALLSPQGFAILSGASLVENERVAMHKTQRIEVTSQSVTLGTSSTPATVPVLDLSSVLPKNAQVISAADEELVNESGAPKYPNISIYVMELDQSGQMTRRFKVNQGGALEADPSGAELSVVAKSSSQDETEMHVTDTFQLVSAYVDGDETKEVKKENALDFDKIYLVDYYVLQPGANMTVNAGNFAGNYYIEANTLFRRQADGRDLPAQFTIPNGKIASSFTFTMASSGDPSTFPFEVEAFPDYTIMNNRCKSLFELAIADEPEMVGDC